MKNDNLSCSGMMLHYISNVLFEICQKMKYSKEIWDLPEDKKGSEDLGTKKYAVSRQSRFQMADSKSIMPQIHKYETLVSEVSTKVMKSDQHLQARVLLNQKDYHDQMVRERISILRN